MRCLTAILVALTVAVVAGCSSQSPSESTPSYRGDGLVGPTWKLVAWFDSYDEGWHELGDEAFDQILVFDENGTFVQDVVGGCCRRTGTWSFLAGQHKLVLRFADGSRDAEYDVRLLEDEKMLLAWPGQHGPVVNRYSAIPHL